MSTVTERALLKRVNRRIAPRNRILRKTRINSPYHDSLGEYHLVHAVYKWIECVHIDLLDLAQRLEVIHPIETMVEAA